jgi:peptidoglycan/LPS O-acetylase OafA/YrhL
MLLRNRRMPAALSWLGRVSYSTYLVHVPLIAAMWLVIDHTVRPHGMLQQLPWMAGFFVVLLLLSQLTYRYVELPMQDLGRRVARRRRDSRPPTDDGQVPAQREAPALADA